MKKFAFTLFASALFLSGTSLAFASVTINSVTLNGSTAPIHVQPGDNITVAVTATLTDGSKWKGTNWGISNNGTMDTCVNTKNAKDGTRNNATGVFTETFTIKAPAQSGIYNANFLSDIANNCGKPASPSPFVITGEVQVGAVTVITPTISAHDDITVFGSATGATVPYDSPLVYDQNNHVLGTATCTPASGSNFAPGNTVVTCTYPKATNLTFNVNVIPPGTLITMAAQKDSSTLCNFETCYTPFDPLFGQNSSIATINLGSGASLGSAGIVSVTIAKDPLGISGYDPTYPWSIKIRCFTDAAYTNACTNWVTPSIWNGGRTDVMLENATTTTDGTHWSAYFTNISHEANFADQTSPVTFNPNYYYQLSINDQFVTDGVYGSPTVPYFVLTGITQ